MKTLTLITISTLIAISTAFASTENDKRVRNITSKIIEMNLDSHTFAGEELTGGTIELANLNSQITVILDRKFKCPRGPRDTGACIQVMPEPIIISMPVTKMEVGTCGEVTYSGKKDYRMADGELQILSVTDFANFHCQTFAPINDVEANYLVYPARMGNRKEPLVSNFVGESFKAIR